MANKKSKKLKRRIKRFFLTFFTLILAILVFAVAAICIIEKGPSEEMRDIFVVSVMQSSAAKPLARLFLSKDQVEEIMSRNTAKEEAIKQNKEMVVIDDNLDKDAIIVKDIKGGTFIGKVMIINDPSRVFVATIPDYTAEQGETVATMCKRHNCIAGINAGGFDDPGGLGSGAIPYGVVISQGQWRNGDKNESYSFIGLNTENKLILDTMTGFEMEAAGIRDAVMWGPNLVLNGQALDVGHGGYNPRTAIGQRADGAIIFIVIDGRQPSSLGASYADLVGLMLQYGAVNAANLDGGYSSTMYYNGEVLNNTAFITGERAIPTAIVVEAR